MLNELSCWTWDWNAFGAISTAVAAATALGVWGHGRFLEHERRRKRVIVSQHLLEEELSRVSAHAVNVWRIAEEIGSSGSSMRRFSQDTKLGLQVSRAEGLISIAEYIPESLGVNAAKSG